MKKKNGPHYNKYKPRNRQEEHKQYMQQHSNYYARKKKK